MTDAPRPYHHGDLRRALLDAALALVAERGPAALSLREVARRAGVSHAAPAHHFANKAGLLTAIAAEGYRRLADALAGADDFQEKGVAYVVFATEHPAHFAVMRAPDLLRTDDADLVAAETAAAEQLRAGANARMTRVDPAAPVAAWALVHGLASLLLEGNVRPEAGETVESLARAVTGHLRTE
ncbi:TetR/AcrR family transcriptional regulator [Virgisporangium ochraceum]|uniref:TetR/AcrR family transcriptional regulator n=1 Tax=Virgisporangium ochraceum TaxID=65505 RepID=UPI001EF39CFE|nr:TetR/AcrR family transcriptional regulator [Virgisporangium ochraceum]